MSAPIGAGDTRLALRLALTSAITAADAGEWEQVEHCLNAAIALAQQLARFFAPPPVKEANRS